MSEQCPVCKGQLSRFYHLGGGGIIAKDYQRCIHCGLQYRYWGWVERWRAAASVETSQSQDCKYETDGAGIARLRHQRDALAEKLQGIRDRLTFEATSPDGFANEIAKMLARNSKSDYAKGAKDDVR